MLRIFYTLFCNFYFFLKLKKKRLNERLHFPHCAKDKTLIWLELPQIAALHKSPVSQCTPSFKQQSQWIILSSICYCMAEGSCAVHTCPATCLHHGARAGCDSVCHCLQWSDYTPVFRHVPPVCSPTTAAVCICLLAGGCKNEVGAGVGSSHVSVRASKQLEPPFMFPHTPV